LLVRRNLFDHIRRKYGEADSAPSRAIPGAQRGTDATGPRARAQDALYRPDDGERPTFQRVCRDYNPDGTCNVFNRALPADPNDPRRNAARAAEIQAEARLSRLDRKINDRQLLPDDAPVGDMTGAEVRRAWNGTRWIIDPRGADYGNPGTGAVDFDEVGGVVRMELGALRDRQAHSRGEQNYQFLHDSPGHTSAQGQRTRNDMHFRHDYLDPRTRRGGAAYDQNSPHFVSEEAAATRRAHALALILNEPFEYDDRRGY
jgi:hypothetical protein